MPDSTLTAIQTKVRRLTRSPSESQLTTAQINEYVNTFVFYDFPEHLRLFKLRTTFTFYTQPFIDTYDSNVTPPNPLANFQNIYISIHEPSFVAGYRTFFSQSRDQFYALYPFLSSITSIGTAGDGVTQNFNATLSQVPVLRNNVTFSSVTAANTGLQLHDDGQGNLVGDGVGFIDYVSGVFDLQFNAAPGAGIAINSQTVPYVASIPRSILFFENKFILRPVPDQPYPVNVEAYIRPTELLAGNSPQLEQWWQYIAYGAAKKVFEDRMDLESVASIMPEFKLQERLVLRTTIVQQTKERSATIYTENIGGPGFYGWGQGWGGNVGNN